MTDVQINCPHCFINNRFHADRITDNPKCGRCKEFLFIGRPMELTADNVEATLSGNDIPVIVDCWASWCGPCQSFAPVFEAAAARLEPNLRFAKLNTEAVPSLSEQWNIRSIPTLLLFRNGVEITRMSGALPLPQLMQWIYESLNE